MTVTEDTQDTLRMLEEAAAAYAKPDAARSRQARDQHHGTQPDALPELAAMGWLAATLPAADGGMGLGLRAAAVIARRLGYSARHEPYVPAGVMPLECLLACGDRGNDLIGALTLGRQSLGLAWLPVDGWLDPLTCGVHLVRQGGSTVLQGICRFVEVPDADSFIVAMQAGDDMELHLVPRETHGLAINLETAADGTRLAVLTFTDVTVSTSSRLASGEVAREALQRAVNAGTLATSAELLGVMERALELTLEYLKTRFQFGRPIGAFQALQHRAVDMWMQVRLTDAALHAALDVFEEEAVDSLARQRAASSSKARASQAALFVCGQAVQLHGAIGFTDECELGLHVNRAVTLAARHGNAAWHRRRYSALSEPVIA